MANYLETRSDNKETKNPGNRGGRSAVRLNYTPRWREAAISILEFGYCNAIEKLAGPFGPILMEGDPGGGGGG